MSLLNHHLSSFSSFLGQNEKAHWRYLSSAERTERDVWPDPIARRLRLPSSSQHTVWILFSHFLHLFSLFSQANLSRSCKQRKSRKRRQEASHMSRKQKMIVFFPHVSGTHEGFTLERLVKFLLFFLWQNRNFFSGMLNLRNISYMKIKSYLINETLISSKVRDQMPQESWWLRKRFDAWEVSQSLSSSSSYFPCLLFSLNARKIPFFTASPRSSLSRLFSPLLSLFRLALKNHRFRFIQSSNACLLLKVRTTRGVCTPHRLIISCISFYRRAFHCRRLLPYCLRVPILVCLFFLAGLFTLRPPSVSPSAAVLQSMKTKDWFSTLSFCFSFFSVFVSKSLLLLQSH